MGLEHGIDGFTAPQLLDDEIHRDAGSGNDRLTHPYRSGASLTRTGRAQRVLWQVLQQFFQATERPYVHSLSKSTQDLCDYRGKPFARVCSNSVCERGRVLEHGFSFDTVPYG